MNNFLEFLTNVNWRLMFVSGLMILISVIVVYTLILMAASVQRRREALKVSLPNINDLGRDFISKPKFKSQENLEVEIIGPMQDVTMGNETHLDEELFTKALARETGQNTLNQENSKTSFVSDDVPTEETLKLNQRLIEILSQNKEGENNA